MSLFEGYQMFKKRNSRVQRIAAQEKYIKAQNMHIQDLHETMGHLEKVNEIWFRDLDEPKVDLRKVTEENILLKQLMSDVSN